MSDSRGASPDDTFRPYRHLAVRVLTRALLDLADPGGASNDRASARIFLNGSGMLLHWCRVAAFEPTHIVRLAEQLAGRPPAFDRASSQRALTRLRF